MKPKIQGCNLEEVDSQEVAMTEKKKNTKKNMYIVPAHTDYLIIQTTL